MALKLEAPGTLKEIINLSFNLDSYDLLEDISDPGRTAAELLRRGKQIEIPEVLYPMLDLNASGIPILQTTKVITVQVALF